MFCSKCGNKMDDREKTCPKCGNTAEAVQPEPAESVAAEIKSGGSKAPAKPKSPTSDRSAEAGGDAESARPRQNFQGNNNSWSNPPPSNFQGNYGNPGYPPPNFQGNNNGWGNPPPPNFQGNNNGWGNPTPQGYNYNGNPNYNYGASPNNYPRQVFNSPPPFDNPAGKTFALKANRFSLIGDLLLVALITSHLIVSVFVYISVTSYYSFAYADLAGAYYTLGFGISMFSLSIAPLVLALCNINVFRARKFEGNRNIFYKNIVRIAVAFGYMGFCLAHMIMTIIG